MHSKCHVDMITGSEVPIYGVAPRALPNKPSGNPWWRGTTHPDPKTSVVSGEWDPNHRCKAQVLLSFLLMVMVPMCHLELVISVFVAFFFWQKIREGNPVCVFFGILFFFPNVFFGQNYSIYKDTLPPKTKQFAPENRFKNRHPAKRKVVSQLPEHHFSGTKPRSHARSMPNPCLTSAKIAWLGNWEFPANMVVPLGWNNLEARSEKSTLSL